MDNLYIFKFGGSCLKNKESFSQSAFMLLREKLPLIAVSGAAGVINCAKQTQFLWGWKWRKCWRNKWLAVGRPDVGARGKANFSAGASRGGNAEERWGKGEKGSRQTKPISAFLGQECGWGGETKPILGAAPVIPTGGRLGKGALNWGGAAGMMGGQLGAGRARFGSRAERLRSHGM